MKLLETILEDLKRAEYDGTVEPASEELPFDQLLVYLGKDFKERDRVMQIRCQRQELGEEVREEDTPRIVRIEFLVELPAKIADIAYPEVASTLLFLNGLLELPGFELHEAEGKILYRYVLMTPEKPFPKQLYLGIIGLITMFLMLYEELLDNIASGKMRFEELIDDILHTAEKIGKSQ